MSSGSTAKIGLVRCPKCRQVLLEPPDVVVYQCGGCGSFLKGNFQNNNAHGTAPGLQENGTAQTSNSDRSPEEVNNAEGNIAMNDGNVMKYLRNNNDNSWVCQFCAHPFRWEVQPQTFRHHLAMICKSVKNNVREAAARFFEAECSRDGGSRTASTSVASYSVAQAGKEAEAETEGSRYDQGAEVQPETFRHHLTKARRRMLKRQPKEGR